MALGASVLERSPPYPLLEQVGLSERLAGAPVGQSQPLAEATPGDAEGTMVGYRGGAHLALRVAGGLGRVGVAAPARPLEIDRERLPKPPRSWRVWGHRSGRLGVRGGRGARLGV